MNACQEAEVEGFRFHDFRHTFVTNMRRAGKQDMVIMAITGHKTMTVFMRYDTVSEEDLKGAVE
jgi:integrase